MDRPKCWPWLCWLLSCWNCNPREYRAQSLCSSSMSLFNSQLFDYCITFHDEVEDMIYLWLSFSLFSAGTVDLVQVMGCNSRHLHHIAILAFRRHFNDYIWRVTYSLILRVVNVYLSCTGCQRTGKLTEDSFYEKLIASKPPPSLAENSESLRNSWFLFSWKWRRLPVIHIIGIIAAEGASCTHCWLCRAWRIWIMIPWQVCYCFGPGHFGSRVETCWSDCCLSLWWVFCGADARD